MKKNAAILGYILFLYLVLEIFCRLYLTVTTEATFFKPSNHWYSFYPELKRIDLYETGKKNLLILGGSVLETDTLHVEIEGNKIACNFCHMPALLGKRASADYNFISMAKSAHNSLDSWYKYQFLKDYNFHSVLFYHGINDTRANNCDSDLFDINYRHIRFYDELFVLNWHKELNITVIPYFFHQLYIKFLGRSYIPREFYGNTEDPNVKAMLKEGEDIKSLKSFERNLFNIADLAYEKKDILIVSEYAYYLPDNYSLEKFRARELDYDQQIFPVELYGLPGNSTKGVTTHNGAIQQLLKLTGRYHFIPFNQKIPKSGEYFDDPCHLNENGCNMLADEVWAVLSNDADL